jgi:hypothetical protein
MRGQTWFDEYNFGALAALWLGFSILPYWRAFELVGE